MIGELGHELRRFKDGRSVDLFHPLEDGKWSPGSVRLLLNQVVVADQYHIEGNVRRGDVVLDIGASIGVFTWHACSLGAMCHSFEPNPKEFRALRAMVNANDLDAIVNRVAISDDKPMVTFFTGHFGALGEGKIVGDRQVDGDHIKVTAVTLDDYVSGSEEIDRLDLIKVDTEGHEIQVLDGARWALQKFEPVIVMSEYHRAGDPERLEAMIGDIIPDVQVYHTNPSEPDVEEILVAIPTSRVDRWKPPNR